MKLINIFKDIKYRFIFFGFINILLTNIILQILLICTSSIKATFVSQMANFFLGYYLYGKKVFKVRKLKIGIFLKYLILVLLLWNMNWMLIDYFYSFGISKNIASLVIVPFLALISYVSQKSVVFKYKEKILLSVIVPCFNEINTLEQVINNIQNSPIASKELIIIDDFSKDGSREFLKNLNSKNIRTIFHDKNLGKGAALSSGISIAKGEITIIQDADLEYDPNEYPVIISPIINNKADVVYGSRFQGGQPHRVVYFWHRVGNGFLTLLSNIFTDLNLTDMETCYKAFKSEILKKIIIEEKRFGFEPEITAKISKLDCRIYEVGISYYGRTYKDGKKIGWKDGVRAIWCILKYNLFR